MPRTKISATRKKSHKKPIEQYQHKGKERVNNPPVGLVTPETDKDVGKITYSYDPHLDPQLQFDSKRKMVEDLLDNGLSAKELKQAKSALEQLKKLQEPYLNWAGKAEHTSFEVSTVSLHVHERIDPRTIIEAVRKRNGSGEKQLQFSLFENPSENPPLRDAIEFYKHKHNWSNRLIAGDSLLVMNSLLEKEGLGGKVQMIYIDPPYGIRYGSNFQPFVSRRDVKDGRDEDLTSEPEMVKAFRDTWELGIHSYLTYLRDRFKLAHALLSESGSIFVQISDENIHLVRNILDEVFGSKNFISLISFATTSGFASITLARSGDYLLWYARDKSKVKYRQLYIEKDDETINERYRWILLPDGSYRALTTKELMGEAEIPKEVLFYSPDSLISQGASSTPQEFEFEGKKYTSGPNSHWKTSIEGLNNLAKRGRLHIAKNSLRYKRFATDFPAKPINNIWADTGTGNFTDKKIYVVQTGYKVVTRCLLMTTDPGDLIFDPTCGSGTTAYVAEQWGRRWITCDTSRVASTLAKQRLMTAVFDYYELRHSEEGVGSGFRYKTVPHITLKSIANTEPPAQEDLYDQPHIDNSKSRVTGPFTVEAVPAPGVKSFDQISEVKADDESVARSGETLRQAEWRAELLKSGIRGKGGQYIRFSRVEPLPGTRWLHADAETIQNVGAKPKDGPDSEYDSLPERVVISFGPEHAPLEQRQVAMAVEEAQKLVPQPDMIVFAAFQFDPEAAKDIDETDWPGVTLLKVQMNADLLTEDLKKKRSSNESFWLIGQPEIKIQKLKSGPDKGKYQVEVLGFDYYNTNLGIIESGGPEKIAMWMIDPDYDGRSLFPRQVFFPMAGENEGWTKLAKNLKAEIDENLIEAYRATVSLPFEAGEYKRIAVKIIDDRGIESLRIINLE